MVNVAIAQTPGDVVNEGYEPNEREESVLEHMKRGRDEGLPWGFTSASIAAEALDTEKQYTSRALNSLRSAGWVERVGPDNLGVYRFVADPRTEGDSDESDV